MCFLPPFARRIFHCFRPALPAFFAFWVKSGSEAVISVEDWRTATLRHSPRDLSSCHKWRKRQGFIGVFVHHSCCVILADGAEAVAAKVVVGRIGVEPAVQRNQRFQMPQRAVSTPTGEGNLRGPQEAFTELLRNNCLLYTSPSPRD